MWNGSASPVSTRGGFMKKIEALISRESISQIRNVLESREITNFMLSNVLAKSTSGAHYVYRGHAYEVEVDAEVKLETVVPDEEATEVAYATLKAAGGAHSSCKPRVLLAPVNQVIIQLDEPTVAPNGPPSGLKQPVETSVRASEPVPNAVTVSHLWHPNFGTLSKMLGWLMGDGAENQSNERIPVATRIAFNRARRRPWLFSLWLAHR
jgi:nitrogen regulatory protein PII